MSDMDVIVVAHHASDLDWYRRSGNCGGCGWDPVNCHCGGICGCWAAHEARYLRGQFWFALLRFVGISTGTVCRVHWSWKCDLGQGRCFTWPDDFANGKAA